MRIISNLDPRLLAGTQASLQWKGKTISCRMEMLYLYVSMFRKWGSSSFFFLFSLFAGSVISAQEDANILDKAFESLERKGEVVFEIHYIMDDDLGTRTRLGQWSKNCDRQLLSIELSLADLKGKSVNFYLVVLADGPPKQDWAIWSSLGVMR